MVSEKSLGTGIGKIWYRKKYRYRYRKHLVPEKKVSVSFNILGTVTHCCTVSAIIVTKIIFCALKYTLSYTLSLLQKYWLHLEEINWDDQGGWSIGVLPGSPTGGFSLSMGFPQILGSSPQGWHRWVSLQMGSPDSLYLTPISLRPGKCDHHQDEKPLNLKAVESVCRGGVGRRQQGNLSSQSSTIQNVVNNSE